MKKALYVNCIMREGSRTEKLADEFLQNLKGYEVTELKLTEENLKPLSGQFFADRQTLLAQGNREHPRFRYAHQFKEADLVIIAAPFWDLCFPALLKIYIENVSVDGITFKATTKGLEGTCKATDLVYLTTRGGIYAEDPMEMAFPQINAYGKFFGIDNVYTVAADGMDVVGYDSVASLHEAANQATQIAIALSENNQ